MLVKDLLSLIDKYPEAVVKLKDFDKYAYLCCVDCIRDVRCCDNCKYPKVIFKDSLKVNAIRIEIENQEDI
jgi:hypothetical protein